MTFVQPGAFEQQAASGAREPSASEAGDLGGAGNDGHPADAGHVHDRTADEARLTAITAAIAAITVPTAGGVPPALTPDNGGAAGAATTYSRSDHVHDLPAAVPVATGSALAEGSSTSVARADHVHTSPTGTPVATGAALNAGSAATLAKSDHVHTVTFGSPVEIGSALADGSSTSAARADHVHTPDSTAWTTYTPQIDQGATTNIAKTVTYARYRKVGRLVIVQVDLSITGTGTAASNITVTLPFNAVRTTGAPVIGTAFVFDASANATYKALAQVNAAGTVRFAPAATTTAGALGADTFTAALANGDFISFQVTYESTT